MDDGIAQELRNFVSASVDARPWRQGLVRWNVANGAADLGEELLSCLGVGACGKVCVADWRACVADFIYQAFQFGFVRLGVRGVEECGAVAGRVRGIFVRVEAIADAEFVAQRIGAGRHQAAVLALPAEAGYLHFGLGTACFEYRSADHCARDPQFGVALFLLILLGRVEDSFGLTICLEGRKEVPGQTS